MRIVAGKHGSRKLKSPADNAIRPTSDKVKGAVFSSLGEKGRTGRFLDCYSGTGNMALEALSRGMDFAVMIDQSPKACALIRENVSALQEEEHCRIYCGDVFSVLPKLKEPFDCIYIDPPYAKEKNGELMDTLCRYDLICPDGVVVVESDAASCFADQIGSLYKYKEKNYRDTKITYYRKKG